jgi:hypothetical protein
MLATDLDLINCLECWQPHASDCGAFCSDACETAFHLRSLADCGVTHCGNPECELCIRPERNAA